MRGDRKIVEAKVRGIYTTALTKLLLDSGFAIVEPSIDVQRRFGLQYIQGKSDFRISIRDRGDRQGVQAFGRVEALGRLRDVLRKALDDVIIRTQPNSHFETPAKDKCLLDIEFPHTSKIKLDEIRRTITPTLNSHHFYKLYGDKVSSTLDMAERLLFMGSPIREVEELFHQTVASQYPVEGCEIDITHVKLDGVVCQLGRAVIEACSEDSIRIRRHLKGGGLYDGLRNPKDEGDYAVTEAKFGSWHLKTRYLTREGKHKGTYININTPVELYSNCLRYVDLEVDVCWRSGEAPRILDEEKLKESVERDIVSYKIYEMVKVIVQKLTQSELSDFR